jgi:hypothetical protein
MIQINVFTNIALFSTFLAWLNKCEFMMCVSYCWMWGILASFTKVRISDPTIYVRMMHKKRITPFVFHSGNIVLHVLPVVTTLVPPFPYITFYHSAVASCLFYSWCHIVSRGTLDLSHVYVYMPRDKWKRSIHETVGVLFVVPLMFHLLSSSTSIAPALPSSSR